MLLCNQLLNQEELNFNNTDDVHELVWIHTLFLLTFFSVPYVFQSRG